MAASDAFSTVHDPTLKILLRRDTGPERGRGRGGEGRGWGGGERRGTVRISP